MKHFQYIAIGAILLPFSMLPSVASGEGADIMEEVVVTGSRIRRNPLNEAAALMDLSRDQLGDTGITNLGDILQDLAISGSAPNSQFNVPGNSGFPQDGSGIGAGSVQLSLRNTGAKRTLVLVDGKRWIAGSSASGVPSTVDLNSIPDNVIKRIEILQDGASAIYGSDAIGGVVNIITNSDYEGFRLDAQTGEYLSDNDGESTKVSALWGGGNDTSHFVLSLSYAEEKGIDTWSRKRSKYPNPDATSCDISGTLCSSFTPQARTVLGPNYDFLEPILNDGVLNDGGANIPDFDFADPFGGDFHPWSNADRFNYNGPGRNFLRTPNERTNIYASVNHQFTDELRGVFTASYTKRQSRTKAAPEPLCFGNGCGNAIADAMFISALNPYNPFGIDLSVANGNLEFIGRRPLESGRRLFFQDVDSYFVSLGLEGEFVVGDHRTMYWDVTASYGDNSGFQEKKNSHNIAKIQNALGDPAVCEQIPNCVPLNVFGGQGPDGTGSITQEMLDYITYTQRDYSDQTLTDFLVNVSGDIATLPAGELGFAVGFEYRDHEGSYRPDPIAERGETAGIPAGSTRGDFDVTEWYAELNIPLISGDQLVEASLAARSSDYSSSGSESTYKGGFLWRPTDDLSLRGSVSTGFRAPGIGELFGGAAREDFSFSDPCSDYSALLGSAANGRDTPQPADIQTNCAALGVPEGIAQLNPQLSAVSAGNPNLDAETSDAWTIGIVYSPSWVEEVDFIEDLTLSIDWYDLEIEDAIEGRNPGDVITACVNTLDPQLCAAVPRTSSGRVDLVNNQLQNIGKIESSGFDIALNYQAPPSVLGDISISVNGTHLSDYEESVTNPDGTVTVNDLGGIHTDETFPRAFPDWRVVTTVDWSRDRWSGTWSFRWTDDMKLEDRVTDLDSVMFSDLQINYNPNIADDAVMLTLGFNNIFDEDPPVCFPCGVIGMSIVSHDLPGRVGYVKFSYEVQ